MSKFLDGLNDRQREATAYIEGPLLILAGAGSGKTRVLTNKIGYLIEKDVVKPWEILAITFTNKAAKEMKERALALDPRVNDVWLGTFHSICVRILKREIEILGYTREFNIFDEQDKEKLIKEILKKLNMDEKKFSPSFIGNHISNAKNDMKCAKDYEKEFASDYIRSQVATVYTMYEKQMKEYNAIDFDDIILLTVKIFLENSNILFTYQNKFKYLLVDEYQDTNKLQFTLISLLASLHGNICVVGDESQSIYGWRGADISNILNFEKEFAGSKIIKLEQNYRSTKTILNAANAVIKNNSSKIDKNLWTDNAEGKQIVCYTAENEYDEVEFIIDKIDDICKKEGRKYSDFAVLYRTNAQSRVIEDVFMKSGTPYKLIGGLKFYARKEIKDLTSYLRFIQNPNDAIALKRIINTPKRGIGDTAIASLETLALDNNVSLFEAIKKDLHYTLRSSGNIEAFKNLALELIELKDKLSVSELIKEIIKKSGYEAMLNEEKTKEAENRFENLMELVGVATEFENENADNSLGDFLESIALVADVDKLDDAAEAVTLMTLHSSKGLEYNVVFLIGMEEGLFPSKRSMEENEEVEEERRLCYVGITRAKETLYISNAIKRTMYGSTNYTIPSRFISELPEELCDKQGKEKKNTYLNSEYASASRVSSYSSTSTLKSESKFFTDTKPKYGVSVDSFLKNVTKSNITSEKKDISKYEVGVKVKHKKFGIGIIEKIEQEGDDFKLEINFETAGFKRLMANFTPLDIIG